MPDEAAILIDMRLDRIGWSVCQAARRGHVSRDRIMRWRRGVGAPSGAFMEWLMALDALHARLASPLSLHVPRTGNRPPMNAYAVARALMIIGWSERRLALHLGYHRTELRRLLGNGGTLGPLSSRWLEALADGHRDLPCPIGSDVRFSLPAPPGGEAAMALRITRSSLRHLA